METSQKKEKKNITMFLSRTADEQTADELIESLKKKKSDYVLKRLEKSNQNEWVKTTTKGFKFLLVAVENSYLGIVDFIIKEFPERLNYQDIYGKSCLFYAVEKEQWSVVSYLITKKINYYMADKNGNSLLHLMAKTKCNKQDKEAYMELVNKLVCHRRIVRGRNMLGETPLHIACLNGNKKMIGILIDNKSLIESKTEKGLTPWDYCQFSDKICFDISQMRDSDDDNSSGNSPFFSDPGSDIDLSGSTKSSGKELTSPRTPITTESIDNSKETKQKEIKPSKTPSFFHFRIKSDSTKPNETNGKVIMKSNTNEQPFEVKEENQTVKPKDEKKLDETKEEEGRYQKFKKYGIDKEKYKKFEELAVKFASYLNPPQPLPPKAPYKKGDRFRVLSLDGGGIKCIYQCTILKRIADKFPDFFDKIDVITGVSASSVPCTAIALGYDLMSVQKMMEDMLSETFSRIINKGGIVGHQYSNKFLFVMGDKVFGDLTIDKITRKLCIPSFLTDSGKNDPNRTCKSQFYNNFTDEKVPYSLTEICLQSAAAPGYFSTVNAHLDGGVIINEPCGGLLPYITGEYGLNVDEKDVVLLSIGAGYPAVPYISEEVGGAGLVKWTLHMPDLQIESRKWFAEFEEKYSLRERFFRLNPKLPYQIDLDDCKDIELIKKMGMDIDLTETFKWIEEQW